MGFFGDLWDDITGASARNDAQDAVASANASNQAAADRMANTTRESTDKLIAERKALVEQYTNSLNQALQGIPGAAQLAPQLANLAAQQRGDTSGIIERLIAAANQPLNQMTNQSAVTAGQQQGAVERMLAQSDQTAAQGRDVAGGIFQQGAITAAQQNASLQPWADAAGQVRGQTQGMLNPFIAQAQGMAGAMNPALAALGLGGQGADYTSLLANSPAFQFQREQNNQATTNAMAARGMGSGRSAANQLAQGDRALVSAELDKNINRAISLGTQGISMGQQLVGQYANAGVNEMQAVANARGQVAGQQGQTNMAGLQQMSNTAGQQGQTNQQILQLLGQIFGQQGNTNLNALQQLSNVQQQAMPYALQGNNQYYQQMNAIAQMPQEDAWRRYQAQQGIQDTGFQNAINSAQMQQQAAIQAAQTQSQAQLSSGQNTANLATQMASTPSLMSQLIPLGVSYAMSSMGVPATPRSPGTSNYFAPQQPANYGGAGMNFQLQNRNPYGG
jgi:hypothetical protein